MTSTFGTVNGFYPYVTTMIHFQNGVVYVPCSNGDLEGINVSSGATTTQHVFSGYSIEGGLDNIRNVLYVSSGASSSSDSISSYNVTTGVNNSGDT